MDQQLRDDAATRAALTQVRFRQLNERVGAINEAFAELIGTFAISCECADPVCIEPIEIWVGAYRAVRADPTRFVVRPDHVRPPFERVVEQTDGYAVVEKIGAGAEVAAARVLADEVVDGRGDARLDEQRA